MFTAVLFIIGKTWKQSNCPSTDDWIKTWYIYIYNRNYPAIKKKEILPLAAMWMDLEIIILSEIRQRKPNIIWYHLYV